MTTSQRRRRLRRSEKCRRNSQFDVGNENGTVNEGADIAERRYERRTPTPAQTSDRGDERPRKRNDTDPRQMRLLQSGRLMASCASGYAIHKSSDAFIAVTFVRDRFVGFYGGGLGAGVPMSRRPPARLQERARQCPENLTPKSPVDSETRSCRSSRCLQLVPPSGRSDKRTLLLSDGRKGVGRKETSAVSGSLGSVTGAPSGGQISSDSASAFRRTRQSTDQRDVICMTAAFACLSISASSVSRLARRKSVDHGALSEARASYAE